MSEKMLSKRTHLFQLEYKCVTAHTMCWVKDCGDVLMAGGGRWLESFAMKAKKTAGKGGVSLSVSETLTCHWNPAPALSPGVIWNVAIVGKAPQLRQSLARPALP